MYLHHVSLLQLDMLLVLELLHYRDVEDQGIVVETKYQVHEFDKDVKDQQWLFLSP